MPKRPRTLPVRFDYQSAVLEIRRALVWRGVGSHTSLAAYLAETDDTMTRHKFSHCLRGKLNHFTVDQLGQIAAWGSWPKEPPAGWPFVPWLTSHNRGTGFHSATMASFSRGAKRKG